METREGFIFYKSFFDAIELAQESEQLPIYRCLVKYGLTGQEPDDKELSAMGKVIWNMAKPQLEKNWRKYQAGCKGGNPNFGKGKPNPYYNQQDNQQDNHLNKDKDKDKEKDKDKDNIESVERKRQAFSPPTTTEVYTFQQDFVLNHSELCAPIKNAIGNNDIDPAANFYDYFTSTGWVLSNGRKMKDWRAAFRKWLRNDIEKLKIKERGTLTSRGNTYNTSSKESRANDAASIIARLEAKEKESAAAAIE